MTCFICKRTGVRECDPEAAEIQCLIYNFCYREEQRELRESDKQTKEGEL